MTSLNKLKKLSKANKVKPNEANIEIIEEEATEVNLKCTALMVKFMDLSQEGPTIARIIIMTRDKTPRPHPDRNH